MSGGTREGQLRVKNSKKFQQEQHSKAEKLLNLLLFFVVAYYGYYVLSIPPSGI